MDLERLAGKAGSIIAMFNHVFSTEKGFDATTITQDDVNNYGI